MAWYCPCSEAQICSKEKEYSSVYETVDLLFALKVAIALSALPSARMRHLRKGRAELLYLWVFVKGFFALEVEVEIHLQVGNQDLALLRVAT